jgi:hypothetical protein
MKKILALTALLLASSSLQAKDSWLFVRPVNYYYDAAKLFVLTDQLKQEVQSQGNVEVKLVERPENGPDLESDGSARKEALSLTKTVTGFTGKVSLMDNTIFVSVFKWNSSGDIVYQERFSLPVGEDIEAVINRLGTCLVTNEKFKKTGGPDNITVKETQTPRRKQGAVILLARAGMLYPIGNSFRVQDYNYSYMTGTVDNVYYTEGTTGSIELGLGYDINYMIMEGVFGFDGTRDAYCNIGGEYLFGKGDFCPYAGADVNVSLVNKAATGSPNEQELEKNSDGFGVGLRVGVLIFRNSTIKFMPEIRFVNVFNKDFDKGIRATIGMMASF